MKSLGIYSAVRASSILLAGVPLIINAQAQVVVPEQFALPLNAVDSTKPGFKVRVVQATSRYGELVNSLARTEAQLAGFLINPFTGQPYENIADMDSWAFNPDGTYDEYGYIQYAANYFPGIPGKEGHGLNIAMEAITFIPLRAGTYSMVVNSDDGFRVTVGNVYDRFEELVLGEFDGGRGAADTVFSFTITKDGTYAFRLIYEQGGGNYTVSWYSADPNNPNNRKLLNEDGGLLCYSALRPGVIQLGPTIRAIYPLPDSQNVPPSVGLHILIEDQTFPFNPSSFRLYKNGIDVTSQVSFEQKQQGQTKIHYTPATLPEPLSLEQYKIVYADPTREGGVREVSLRYKVSAYANYNLPEPIWYEDFESTPEGSLPPGWKTWSPIPPVGREDLNDPNSDSYRTWTVISVDRMVQIGNNGIWNHGRRLNTPEAYINGQRVTSLMQNRFVYMESDIRSGSQYAELLTPIIDLSGKTNIYLVFNSAYEQNQDNIAGIEYSIDGGITWHPVVYMLDVPDILKDPNGNVDPIATLTNQYNDVAVYTDPNTGQQVGGNYGAFLRVTKDRWSELGPYFSGRVNDDPWESKRVEKYRLPLADGQSRVQIRFFYAGTASWYWGIDNVGLYSISTVEKPLIQAEPEDATRIVGSWITFKVDVLGEKLSYQWYKDGAAIPGATNATLTIEPVSISHQGDYICIISNPAGLVQTRPAHLTVIQPSLDVSSLRTGLFAYFQFEQNLTDASGNGRHAKPVGSPGFQAGKVGQWALQVSNRRQTSSFNYVTLGPNADVPLGQNTDFTVAFWMKTQRVEGDPSIIANKSWASGNNVGWTIGTQADGRIEWNYKRSGASRKDLDFTQWGPILNDGRWAHVAIVWHINGSAETYFNGILVDSRTIAPADGDIFDPSLSLNIGQDGTGHYGDGEWDGLLDEVAFWDRALTADEVATLFAVGAQGYDLLQGPPQQVRLEYVVQGNQVRFSWQASGFVLQQTADVTKPESWTDVPNSGPNEATVPIEGKARYFRLKKKT